MYSVQYSPKNQNPQQKTTEDMTDSKRYLISISRHDLISFSHTHHGTKVPHDIFLDVVS